MDSQPDDIIINSLLNSSDLKDIIKKLVKNENKGHKVKDSAINKLTEILRSETHSVTSSRNVSTIPINDLKTDKTDYTQYEIETRCSLASLFRLMDLEGWTRTIFNLISVRDSKNSNNFFVNPFGLLYHEVTAASLIKIDIEGNVVDTGSTILKLNKSNWKMQQAIFKARADVNCVVQVSIPDVVAISSLKLGLRAFCPASTKLLDTSSHSLSRGGVKYHQLEFDSHDFQALLNDLSDSKVIFLRNVGLVVCAQSVAEAWLLVKTTVVACQNQLRLLQLCGKSIQKPDEVSESTTTSFSEDHVLEAELEFEAMMRLLDNAGYRTGHKYTSRRLLTPRPKTVKSSEEPVQAGGDSCVDMNGDGVMQVCPMPDLNGDMEHEDSEHEQHGEINNEENDNDSFLERETVKEICAEVIDNSIKIVQDSPEENHTGGNDVVDKGCSS